MQRKASVNRFLNVEHSAVSRVVVGSLLCLFALLCTFEWHLAREMFRRIYVHDQYKTAFRRASFYARRGWMRLNVSKDLVFVFCSDLNAVELRAIRRFLELRCKGDQIGMIMSDLSYVSAMQVIAQVDQPSYEQSLATFSSDIENVLGAIRNAPFEDDTPMEEKPKDTFDVAKAELALSDFATVMQEMGHDWFILSGTLLGAVRDGGFLKHDYDIDVGVHAGASDLKKLVSDVSAHSKFLCGEMDAQTIFKKNEAGEVSISTLPVFMKVVHEGGIHIDVFVHYTEGPTTWHASSLFRWDNTNFDLAEYTLGEVRAQGPKDFDRYLTENYGAWRIPKTDFQSATDTTNQRVVCNPLSVAIFLRRVWLSQSHNPQGAAALLEALTVSGFLRVGKTGQYEFMPEQFSNARHT